jgi:hypothetical protein
VPADAYAQKRPREVVELVREPAREKGLILCVSVPTIALKTEIVDDLVGIERQVYFSGLHHDIVQSVVELSARTEVYCSLADRTITDRFRSKPEMAQMLRR